MIFNDFGFLFLFLPAVVLGFAVVPRSLRRELLIVASLVFYGMSGIEHALVLIVGAIWVYSFARSDSLVGNTPRLLLAIAGPLGALFYYKYFGFFFETLDGFSGDEADVRFSLFAQVLLPAGISFFTFQMMAFAIDRYRGEMPDVPDFRTFALYISFFPQLVAGPILRLRQVAEPIANLAHHSIDQKNLARAAGYIVSGLLFKVVLADSLSAFLSPAAAQPGDASAAGAAYVLLGYSFQIYFDFYGYSLIAIGLGTLFGFKFPDNFLRPYESLNPREFWRRWHTTLSYWIRDYLYFSLGGNRNYVRNIVIVFAVCGLWHGAGWNFVVWGLYHAGLVVGYASVQRWWDRMPRLAQLCLNFSLVSAGWLLFLFDFQGAAALAGSLAGLGTGAISGPGISAWITLLIAAAVCFGVNPEKIIEAQQDAAPRSQLAYGATLGALFFVSLTLIDRSQTFIYFRF